VQLNPVKTLSSDSERMSATNINSVFYANSYHPIQAGSIDGTDTLPHDNAVYRALLCSSAGLCTSLSSSSISIITVITSLPVTNYLMIPDDPFGDPKVIGDPYCTLFVGRLSHQTDEESLRKVDIWSYGQLEKFFLFSFLF